METEIPKDANQGCVGPASDNAGKASACEGCPNQASCAAGEGKAAKAETLKTQQLVSNTFSKIGRTILVLSGKGGVGKSTFSTQLAFGLARRGMRVGLLDVDICGPSIPYLCGLSGQEVHQSNSGWSPVYVDVESDMMNSSEHEPELGVMSIGFLMPDPDSAVIWRGPRKNGLIQQFFTSVDWGTIDYLIVDTPPGTSDEHISIVQMLKQTLGPNDGAVVVTTPQEVSMMDVRKELNFCKQTGLRVLGVVENMSKLQLPFSSLQFIDKENKDKTSEVVEALKKVYPQLLDLDIAIDVFPSSQSTSIAENQKTPENMAKRFGCPYLGKIPLDPKLQQACEDGAPAKALKGSAASKPLNNIIDTLIKLTGGNELMSNTSGNGKSSSSTTNAANSASGVISVSKNQAVLSPKSSPKKANGNAHN